MGKKKSPATPAPSDTPSTDQIITEDVVMAPALFDIGDLVMCKLEGDDIPPLANEDSVFEGVVLFPRNEQGCYEVMISAITDAHCFSVKEENMRPYETIEAKEAPVKDTGKKRWRERRAEKRR